MSRSQGRGVVVLLIAAAVSLAGCAAEPEPTAPPAAELTPTPTLQPIADPRPRTPAGCDELVGATSVEALLGVPAPAEELTVDDLRGPPAAAMLQEGLLSCGWDAGDASVNLLLTPLDVFAEQPAGRDRLCSGQQCGAWEVAGSFFLEVHAVHFGATLDAAAFDAFLDAAVAASAGDALPAWPSPERGTAEYLSCDGLNDPALTTALGAEGPAENQNPLDGFTGAYEAGLASGAGECDWRLADGGFSISYLPGGAWALPRAGEAIDVEGAEAATLSCSDGWCAIHARVAQTWVMGGFADGDRSPEAAATLIATVIPYLPVEPAPAP